MLQLMPTGTATMPTCKVVAIEATTQRLSTVSILSSPTEAFQVRVTIHDAFGLHPKALVLVIHSPVASIAEPLIASPRAIAALSV